MNSSVRQKVLRHLAAMSLAANTGLAAPSVDLLRVPVELVTDAVDETEDLTWRSEDKHELLRLLAQDPRPAVRVRVAEAAGTLWPSMPHAAANLLRHLARDRSPEVHWAASRGLSRLLQGAAPVDRLQIACEWTVSDQQADRRAIAAALSHPTPILAADMAISQLASDRDAIVRQRAARAALVHFQESPREYQALAERLAGDSNAHVRRSARRLLKEIALSTARSA